MSLTPRLTEPIHFTASDNGPAESTDPASVLPVLVDDLHGPSSIRLGDGRIVTTDSLTFRQITAVSRLLDDMSAGKIPCVLAAMRTRID